jgi:hypothetical protein
LGPWIGEESVSWWLEAATPCLYYNSGTIVHEF